MTLTMAEVKLIEELTGKTAGECQKCHEPVDKHSFWCRKHVKYNWVERDRRKRERLEAPEHISTQRRHLYKENGIVQKTGKSLPKDTPTFYDNYKEPLKTVKEALGEGYGYMGVVATDESKDFIQCHICGELYEELGGHTVAKHKIKLRDYKEKYGLAMGTALIGERLRDVRIKASELAVEAGFGKKRGMGSTEWLKTYYDRVEQTVGRRPPGGVNGRKAYYSLETQNKRGMCPDQIVEKLTDLIKILDRVPSRDEFTRHYHSRYMNPIRRHFGDWAAYVEAAGYQSVKKAQEDATTPEQLIKYLKEFYSKHGRVPMNSDFKRGIVVSRYHYFKHFGTLNNARIEANLPAIIPIPGHRYYLVKPEQYEDYQALKDQVTNGRKRTAKNYAFYDDLEMIEYYGEVHV